MVTGAFSRLQYLYEQGNKKGISFFCVLVFLLSKSLRLPVYNLDYWGFTMVLLT